MAAPAPLEYIHKGLVRLMVESGDLSVPGVVQTNSRATIKLCVFQTQDAQASQGKRHHHSSTGSHEPAADTSERLESMIRDVMEGNLFAKPQLGLAVAVATSNIPYVCTGVATHDVVVGAGDMASSHFPALDMALLSMRKGDVCVFAASRRLGYTRSQSDLVFEITVNDVYNEIELVAPRRITKHIVRRQPESTPDSYGFLSPVYGGTAKIAVFEVHRFTDTPTAPVKEEVEIGGPDVPEWKTAALLTMQAGEFATVRVSETGATYKVQLQQFINPEPPRTIPQLAEKISQLKQSGNDLISKRHPRAHVRYEAGMYWLRLMLPRLLPNPEANPAGADQLQELEALLEGNLAQAFLAEGSFDSAIDHASRALELRPQGFKNFFRRAKAKKALRQLQSAIMDLNKAESVLEEIKTPLNSQEWKIIQELRFEIDCEMSP